jgi:hypothetical protein
MDFRVERTSIGSTVAASLVSMAFALACSIATAQAVAETGPPHPFPDQSYAEITQEAGPSATPVEPRTAVDLPDLPTLASKPRLTDESSGNLADWFHRTLLWGQTPYRYVTLPTNLLWKLPLANQREPRFFGKFINLHGQSYIDTAIGAQLGLGRIAPEGVEDEGLQLDVFGAVFTRFNPRRFLTAADYRAGIPLTYKKGPWSTKFGYEHTSTHIGDEYSQAYARRQVPLVIDEMVYGLSRYFGDHGRVYGQVGYAFHTAKETNADRRYRFDWGVSYSNYRDTGPVGRPFAALDMDLRQYESYRANTTFQIGWQWVHATRSVRLALELYDGRSPYGQFYLNDERWAGIGGYFDW